MRVAFCTALTLIASVAAPARSFGDDRIFGASGAVGQATLDANMSELQEPAPSDAAQAEAHATYAQGRRHAFLGIQGDVGLPDGAGVSLALHPWHWLLLNFGVTTNGSAYGLRGGITVVPFQYWISPSMTVEAGHMFEGDMNPTVRLLLDEKDFELMSLKRVSYDYVNGQVGLELGVPNRFTFFLRAGVSYLRSEIKGFEADIQKLANDPNIYSKNPVVTYVGPSGKVGLLIYFW